MSLNCYRMKKKKCQHLYFDQLKILHFLHSGKEDYIYVAASQISRAQSSEANGDFEVAFAYYKSSVGILLHGVQGMTESVAISVLKLSSC